jgi:hypothetical protein
MALLLAGVDAAFLLCLLVLAVPVLVLALQVIAAPRAGRERPLAAGARPALAVLVPAHDEAARIGATLASLRAQLQRGDRLLVVADNCSDDTAVLAHLGGAEVAIRSDPIRRGKGHALAFGIGQLDAAPPKVVIVVDAGCLLDPGAVDALARACAADARPQQPACLVPAHALAAPASLAAQFARILKQRLRPLGWQRLGFGCQLSGSAVALPWALARGAPLAGPRIVAGQQLGLELALAGAAPQFCPQATVTRLSAGRAVAGTRRAHGHLTLAVRYGPRMLWQSLARRDLQLFALVLDLCVPPASLLLVLASLLGLGGAAGWAVSGRTLPWALAPLLPALLAAVLGLAWHKAGRDILPARQLGHALLYALAKIPFYLCLRQRRRTPSMQPVREEPWLR